MVLWNDFIPTNSMISYQSHYKIICLPKLSDGAVSLNLISNHPKKKKFLHHTLTIYQKYNEIIPNNTMKSYQLYHEFILKTYNLSVISHT